MLRIATYDGMLGVAGRQLLRGHLEAAVADDGDRPAGSAGRTCAPIAAGTAKPIVPRPPELIHVRGCVEPLVLGRAHLVLPDAGDDDRVAAAWLVDGAP